MAKKNVKTDQEVVEQPETVVPPIPEGTGDAGSTPATPEQPDGDAQKLQVQPEQGSGEAPDGKENPGLDSGIQATSVIPEGSETGDQPVKPDENESALHEAVNVPLLKMEAEEKTELRNRIAKEVFEKNACKVLYFTADMIPFFAKADAINHGARTLKDDTVVTVNRE